MVNMLKDSICSMFLGAPFVLLVQLVSLVHAMLSIGSRVHLVQGLNWIV